MNKKKLRPDAAKLIEDAQLTVLEHALVGFVEQIDGKVPTDKDILEHGFHVQFAAGPLSVFEKDGKKFVNYYVWRGEHVVAHGFLDGSNPTTLSIVLVPNDAWPPALFAYVDQVAHAKKKREEEQ